MRSELDSITQTDHSCVRFPVKHPTFLMFTKLNFSQLTLSDTASLQFAGLAGLPRTRHLTGR